MEVRVVVLWVVAFLVLFALDLRARRDDRVDRWFWGLGLPMALFVSLGLAVDHWARSGSLIFRPEVAILLR